MGFAVVAATAIFALLALASLQAALQTLWEPAETTLTTLTDLVEEKALRSRMGVRVEAASLTVTSDTVKLNVTNVGSASIPADGFRSADLILVYTALSNGSPVASRFPYRWPPANDSWSVEAVYTHDSAGEAIHPIDQDASTGQWDPGEKLRLTITLSPLNHIDTSPGRGLTAFFSTGRGATALASKTW